MDEFSSQDSAVRREEGETEERKKERKERWKGREKEEKGEEEEKKKGEGFATPAGHWKGLISGPELDLLERKKRRGVRRGARGRAEWME